MAGWCTNSTTDGQQGAIVGEKTGGKGEKIAKNSEGKQGENKEKAGRRQRENKGENIDKNDWGTFTPKL